MTPDRLKKKIYTEKKIYPYVTDAHLRLDMLPRLRQMAINRYQAHPWKNMTDSELLQSARLIGEDMETGQKGYNLAAIMLLGRDAVIKDVCPAYRTDALLRKVNIDRYDDRLIVETNIIESYEQLMMFSEKHLWDKFYLEGDARISLRSIISREILVNMLIHREFTSSYIARFVIEKHRMFTENANRADSNDVITLDNFKPNPKNPIIAAFFRNIWLADELGSGTRRLHHYVPRYSGKPPEMIDGDIFKIIVPLDNEYSFDMNITNGITINDTINDTIDTINDTINDTIDTINDTIDTIDTINDTIDTINDTNNIKINETRSKIMTLIGKNPKMTARELSERIGITERNIKNNIKTLKDTGLLEREGSRKYGRWIVKQYHK